ncbi:glycine/D-amino acid oxidase-like deaminating enzyme [Haloferula luteola]|uniref:Glycine/D-amino acid oxidase-like deaminating enzyme n=1 Tax=Haloferula luteola TaxID=595692 RepID=A0A840V777_9BACT|nr:FAD-dependent oxidoreductase [Haloferula luteola]MBB5350598.1 glycine/D-amino acid oxidase-like deaminating enzyme [Haloferula luteola]
MNLTSEHPYWAVKNGILGVYPSLEGNTKCDVAVLGAGITGAILAEALSADGHDVVVLDRRDVCHGSTSASTALLQYEIDTHLIDLMERHGRERAERAYLACHRSIDLLEDRIQLLGLRDDCGFARKDSVYLASQERDVDVLRREAVARRKIGIDVDTWAASEVKDRLGLSHPLALASTQAAEVDAYRLAHGLLAVAAGRGVRILDRTEVTEVTRDRSGSMHLVTDRGHVGARWVVVASGYEAVECFDVGKLVSLHQSFALASEPMAQRWWKDCLLWESARPYFYLRTDRDGRAILGGEDVPFRRPGVRGKALSKKLGKLENRFRKMFPELPMEVAYGWAGTFGETSDGLAYLGEKPGMPGCLFALGYGGNGITYSVIAGEIIRERILGKKHEDDEVFAFDR